MLAVRASQSGNEMDEIGAAVIAGAVGCEYDDATLTSIDLSNNKLGTIGAMVRSH